jgi:hypothetical protein
MTEQAINSDREPDWEKLRPVLDDAIHELNDRDREAVLLYFFDKRTFGDLGSKLRLTESGARTRVERALNKLRLSLGRRGITSTSAALALALGGQVAAAVPGSLVTMVTASALAGASPSGGAVLFSLMTITKMQMGAAIAVVLSGATIMGVVQHQEISTLRTQRDALLNESAVSGRRASELAGKLAEKDAALAKARTQLASLKSAGGSIAGGAAANSQASGPRLVHLKDVIRDHPEFVLLEQKELRRNIVRTYSRAIAALNLPPDQATQLKDLLVEREMASSDA